MIWGTGTVVLKLTYSSRLPTDSIINSPDKAGVFPSFYDTTTFPAYSIPYPSSDIFPRPPPLPFIPVKPLWWSLSNCLNFDTTDFLAFAFVLSGVEPAQICLPFFPSLEVMFPEHLVWRNQITGGGASYQSVTRILILHILEWKKNDPSHSITFRTFQNQVSNKTA